MAGTTRVQDEEVFCSFFLLFLFSVLFIMASSLMIALSWTGFILYQDYEIFYENDVGLYGPFPTLSDVLGAIVIVNTVVGFAGMFKRSSNMIFTNGFIFCVTFFAILAAICLALTVDSDAYRTSLNIPVQDIADPEINAKLDKIQHELGCCGSNDYRDYLSVQFPDNMNLTIVSKPDESSGNIVTIVLPATCCMDPEEAICTGIWSIGCTNALVNKVETNFKVISGILGGMMVLNLLVIVLSILVFRTFRKEENEKALKEQMEMVPDEEKTEKDKHSNYDDQASSFSKEKF